MVAQGTATLDDPAAGATLQAKVLHGATSCDPARVSISQAALLAWAVDHVTATSVDQAVLSRQHLSLVLRRFEPAMRRWRWDLPEGRKREPVQWPITSEREVQDILYLILRSMVDSVAHLQKTDLYSEIVAFIYDASAAVRAPRRHTSGAPGDTRDLGRRHRVTASSARRGPPYQACGYKKARVDRCRQESDRRRQEPERKGSCRPEPWHLPPRLERPHA